MFHRMGWVVISRYHALFVFDHFLAIVAELANVLWLSSRTIPGFYGRSEGNIKDEWIEVFYDLLFIRVLVRA